MISCSFMEKNQNIYIYEIHFNKLSANWKKKRKTQILSHNFYNSNIYDAGKDIARVCSYKTGICNWNMRHILLKNASRSRPQASPKNTEGTLLFHLYLKSVFFYFLSKEVFFYIIENKVIIIVLIYDNMISF